MRRWLGMLCKKHMLMAFCALLLLLLIPAYLTVSHYPRIVRSAYYRNPIYAIWVLGAECVGKQKMAKSAAMARIRAIGLSPSGEPQFLCLLHAPEARIDKPIFDRYFGLLSQVRVRTSESSFWQVPVASGMSFVEVTTGNVIYMEFDANDSAIPRYYPAGVP